MAEDERGDAFLSRWSRRKQAARRGEALPEPVATEAPAAIQPPPIPEPPAELPPVDTLKGLESDYRAFMSPQVDASTRSAALRRLFSDPHFNVMDGLDIYIDDYSIEDPIPNAMLKMMSGARTLGLFDDDEEKKQAAVAPSSEAIPASEAAVLGTDPTTAADAAAHANTPLIVPENAAVPGETPAT